MDEPTDAYQELFEHSPDAILIIEEERFVDCNPAAARMLRFPNKQALLERESGSPQGPPEAKKTSRVMSSSISTKECSEVAAT